MIIECTKKDMDAVFSSSEGTTDMLSNTIIED
jgi:hypothetical protein